MSMNTVQSGHDSLTGLLQEYGEQAVQQAGPRRWKLAFGDGAADRAFAAEGGDWLTLDAPWPGRRRSAHPRSLWAYLECNKALAGGAKLVLTGKDRLPRIRVDVPVEEGLCSAKAIRAAARALRAAIHCIGKAGQAGPCAPEAGDADPQACDLEELCTSSGWPFARRAGGALSVRLESLGATHHASLTTCARGVSAAVHLAVCDALGAGACQALAVCLLTASGLVRMARATAARQEDGRTVLGFEVVLDVPATAQQLDRGLCALSVACGLYGPREIAALQDERMAERYLAIRGWASNRMRQEPLIRKGLHR